MAIASLLAGLVGGVNAESPALRALLRVARLRLWLAHGLEAASFAMWPGALLLLLAGGMHYSGWTQPPRLWIAAALVPVALALLHALIWRAPSQMGAARTLDRVFSAQALITSAWDVLDGQSPRGPAARRVLAGAEHSALRWYPELAARLPLGEWSRLVVPAGLVLVGLFLLSLPAVSDRPQGAGDTLSMEDPVLRPRQPPEVAPLRADRRGRESGSVDAPAAGGEARRTDTSNRTAQVDGTTGERVAAPTPDVPRDESGAGPAQERSARPQTMSQQWSETATRNDGTAKRRDVDEAGTGLDGGERERIDGAAPDMASQFVDIARTRGDSEASVGRGAELQAVTTADLPLTALPRGAPAAAAGRQGAAALPEARSPLTRQVIANYFALIKELP